jgi:hypothetical protein
MPTFLEQDTSHSTSTGSASTASGNMDDALVLASTAVGNTEDVLVVDSPPSGAQSSKDNDVQIVAAPWAVAVEERPHKKIKNNDNGNTCKQNKLQKCLPISDTDLEK